MKEYKEEGRMDRKTQGFIEGMNYADSGPNYWKQEVEKWKQIATDLYNAYTGTIEEDASREYVDAVGNYRQAIKEGE